MFTVLESWRFDLRTSPLKRVLHWGNFAAHGDTFWSSGGKGGGGEESDFWTISKHKISNLLRGTFWCSGWGNVLLRLSIEFMNALKNGGIFLISLNFNHDLYHDFWIKFYFILLITFILVKRSCKIAFSFFKWKFLKILVNSTA